MLNSCPLCNGVAKDKGYGVECTQCGLWLGDNTNDLTRSTGLTYQQIWNGHAYLIPPKHTKVEQKVLQDKLNTKYKSNTGSSVADFLIDAACNISKESRDTK
jgi:hypothetical protein